VPTLAIHGRDVTAPEQAGGEVEALRVADALIHKARTAATCLQVPSTTWPWAW
jgi:hypothetical protein